MGECKINKHVKEGLAEKAKFPEQNHKEYFPFHFPLDLISQRFQMSPLIWRIQLSYLEAVLL